MQAKLLYKTDTVLGEGPVWDDRRQLLVWVDIVRGLIHEYDPVSNQDQAHYLGTYVGTAVLRQSAPGYVVGTREGIALFEPGQTKLTYLARPEGHQPGHRFNDGKADPAGRFWGGTMQIQPRQPAGALYCLAPDGTLNKRLENITVANGLDWWEPREEMYFTDTPTRQIRCFAYDQHTGQITFKRVAVTISEEEGMPDGFTLDADGNLWVALYGGGKVLCIDPTSGKRLARVEVPTALTSCPAFGGADYRTLYITTIAENNEDDALAGGVFTVQPGVQGRPAWRFGG